ncbi:MAG: phage major capsid protein [Actinobacteria bacterium]|nr:phage major capsid protein [Actinomycetota bacterium]
MNELQKRLLEISKEMEGIEAKGADITAEEEARFDQLIVEFKELKEKAEKETVRKNALDDLKKSLTTPVNEPTKPPIEPANDGFRSLGEFIQTVRFNPFDKRLTLKEPVKDKEGRELSVGTPSAGGYLVPTLYITDIKIVNPQTTIVRPRATVIPAGDMPDQSISMVTLDQTATDGSGLFGGVQFEWIGEGEEKPEQNTALKEVGLSPYEIAGHIVVSDKLLRNAPAIEALVSKLFRNSINQVEDYNFLRGSGTAKPTGIIGHGATIDVNRSTAGKIKYADIVNIFSKILWGGSFIWVGSPTILPELMTMKDFEAADSDAPNLVWQPDARNGNPGTLLGLPVFMNANQPVLGSRGDLILADFSYYLIKDGYGIAIDASPHVYFKTNKTVIKAFWNVDGKPWLTAPITLPDGVCQVSPFVELDVPSVSS